MLGYHPPWEQTPPEPDPPGADTPLKTRLPPEADSSIRSTSGRYASYWNAFLLIISLGRYVCVNVKFRICDVYCVMCTVCCVRLQIYAVWIVQETCLWLSPSMRAVYWGRQFHKQPWLCTTCRVHKYTARLKQSRTRYSLKGLHSGAICLPKFELVSLCFKVLNLQVDTIASDWFQRAYPLQRWYTKHPDFVLNSADT